LIEDYTHFSNHPVGQHPASDPKCPLHDDTKQRNAQDANAGMAAALKAAKARGQTLDVAYFRNSEAATVRATPGVVDEQLEFVADFDANAVDPGKYFPYISPASCILCE
jgi:hypothetical protein